MVKFGLQICARLENIKEFFVNPSDEDIRWYMKVSCSGCGEVVGKKHDNWVYLDREVHSTQNGQSANFVTKCKSCKREMTIQILENTLKPYKLDDDHPDGKFQEVVQFEARGAEPTDYDFRAGWSANAEISTTSFQNLVFDEEGWVEYDDKARLPVGIYDLKSRFVKI